MSEFVILVDEQDRPTGTAEKHTAHTEGFLHRAVSVFAFNERGQMLLQQRHPDKYHSGGLWSNACCTHPRPGESTASAAVRRMEEELGIRCVVHPAFTFVYRVQLDGLVEHEYDHVFVARNDGPVSPDPTEVSDVRWIDMDRLHKDVEENPKRYTYWFRRTYRRAFRVASSLDWW